jgi:hypothetical protein
MSSLQASEMARFESMTNARSLLPQWSRFGKSTSNGLQMYICSAVANVNLSAVAEVVKLSFGISAWTTV